ncbi:hypothetical protein D3C74_190140 [compost metagenome]
MIEGLTCVFCKVKVISEQQNHCCNNCVSQHAILIVIIRKVQNCTVVVFVVICLL